MATPSERRRSARFPVGNARVDCRRYPFASLRGNLADRVLDVSASGAKVLMHDRVPAGCRMRVRLHFPGKNELIETPAEVVWARGFRRGERAHVAGLQFEAAPQQIAATLERLRRSATRRYLGAN